MHLRRGRQWVTCTNQTQIGCGGKKNEMVALVCGMGYVPRRNGEKDTVGASCADCHSRIDDSVRRFLDSIYALGDWFHLAIFFVYHRCQASKGKE